MASVNADQPYKTEARMCTPEGVDSIRWFSVEARKILDPVTGGHVCIQSHHCVQ